MKQQAGGSRRRQRPQRHRKRGTQRGTANDRARAKQRLRRTRLAAAAGGASFMFDPPTLNQAKGSTFTVNVMLTGGQNVYSVPVQLNYDPNQLQVFNVSNGGFLSQDGQTVALVHRDDHGSGHSADHSVAASWSREEFRARERW